MTTRPDTIWTRALKDRLRALWDEGLTARQIAERLNVTRNAVIGAAHRSGCEARPSPVKRPGYEPPPRGKHYASRPPRPVRAPKAAQQRAPELLVPRPSQGMNARRLRKMALPAPIFAQCQWIAGEPSADDACKCLKPALSGAYCAEHFLGAFSWTRERSAPREPHGT